MRLPIIILSVLFLFTGCNRKTQSQIPGKPPYPTVAEQRAALQNILRTPSPRVLDSARIISILMFLSSPACEGRRPGTPGHLLALDRVVNEMRNAGVDSIGSSILQQFEATGINGTTAGINVIGKVEGTTNPSRYIVVTAHYDHLGKTASGEIFHGADDNASGVAALLAMAKYFRAHPVNYSLLFVALDREESGLEGAHAFVQQFVPAANIDILMNINMDMIARSDKNEIFVSGVFHYPSLSYLVEDNRSKTTLTLLMGHDTGSQTDDWTTQSDHAAFHTKKIPFLYFGVEDHPDYHKITDTHDKIHYGRYIEAANLIAGVIKTVK
jgi:Zn-dependent M28 family amino/carboxypeptidase